MTYKIKKIHKIIFLFLLIFLVGIYYSTVYIGNTMDQKTDTDEKSEINGGIHSDKEATQIN
ncbi:hypothetical protein J8L88_01290 [Aquimarina sp. MMG015]|uniref:hypothetical protein n=1 Tax=Aquimarina sp. Aq107 TaxID=1191912 RepID=UPI0004179F78|nr:hypothetical protein [Aquimarina sp. Aq107]AXT57291.1 hypothetical protein D1815_16640 [Aquimarina sp. AD1]MBQ4801466.1 hypothetical protein [Aquimarina sp. MMG015]